MAKKIKQIVRLHMPGGEATAQPPVGPSLAPHGVNIMEFCKAFNASTESMKGWTIPTVVTVYTDRSFSFATRTPLASELLKRAAGLAKGAREAKKEKVGSVTREQVEEIARRKMSDLNVKDLEAAVRTIAGTARSMGIEVLPGE